MIRYKPSEMLRKVAPKKAIKGMVNENLSLKKSALKLTDKIDALSKKSVNDVALKALKNYKKRVKENPELAKDLKKDPKLLIQRVQNEVVLQITEGIKANYSGASYTWLPSDADEPDPEHQLNYGKQFLIGDGEMPGDRPGCRCGMDIHVEGTKLEI